MKPVIDVGKQLINWLLYVLKMILSLYWHRFPLHYQMWPILLIFSWLFDSEYIDENHHLHWASGPHLQYNRFVSLYWPPCTTNHLYFVSVNNTIHFPRKYELIPILLFIYQRVFVCIVTFVCRHRVVDAQTEMEGASNVRECNQIGL